MSSLWTPGGEVPVDRDQPRQPAPPGTPAAPPDDATDADAEELRERYEAMQQQVLAAPAADVVVQHAASLYELAALHLGQEAPRLADARVLIDALTALVDGLGSRLGEGGQALAGALPQLRMAFVEASDRAKGSGPGGDADPDVG